MIKLKLIPSPPITLKIESVKPSKPEEDKFVELDMTHGNQGIYPSEGKTMKRVVIHQPRDLVYSNIREGCNIGGIIGQMKARKPEKSVTFRIVRNGTYGAQSTELEAIGLVSIDVDVQPVLEDKRATPTETQQVLLPAAPAEGFSRVIIDGIQASSKEDVEISQNGPFEIVPASGQYLKKVKGMINVPSAEAEEVSKTVYRNGTFDLVPTAPGKLISKAHVVVNVDMKELKHITITPSSSRQELEPDPDADYDGWDRITVNAVDATSETFRTAGVYERGANKFYKKVTVTPRLESKYVNPSDTTQVVEVSNPDTYAGLSKVTVYPVSTPSRKPTFTANGDYTAPSGLFYKELTVAVPDPPLQAKTATPTESQQVITPDTDKYGLSQVTIAPIDAEERTNITLTSEGAFEINPTASGKYIKKVTGMVTIPSQQKSLTITENGEYHVYPDAGRKLTDVGITVNVEGGGGGDEYVPKVYFFDYDGTPIETWEQDEVADKEELPDLPINHPRLEAQGWNWTLEQIQEYMEANETDIWVGVMYDTVSHMFELDYDLVPNAEGPYVEIQYWGEDPFEVDWGDGTVDSSGSHTYSDYGQYTVKFAIPAELSELGFGTGVNFVSAMHIPAGTSGNLPQWFEPHGLRYVTFPNDITEMYDTLTNATRLKALTLPAGLTMFSCELYGYSLTKLSINPDLESVGSSYGAFCECRKLQSVTIPPAMEELGEDCFGGCGLKRVVIPANITIVHPYAFGYCAQLTKMTIVEDPDHGIALQEYAFGFCSGLKEITLPHQTTFESSPFYGCYGLETVSLGEECDAGDGFQECCSLKTVNIASGCSFGAAFCYCTSLTTVNIDEGVEVLGYLAFNICTSLERITLPSTITEVAGQVFEGCMALETIDFSACEQVPTLGDSASAFQYVSPYCRILVPADLYDDWIAADNWSTIAYMIDPV